MIWKIMLKASIVTKMGWKRRSNRATRKDAGFQQRTLMAAFFSITEKPFTDSSV